MVGPNPLYIPLNPSSRHTARPVPTKPRSWNGRRMLIESKLHNRRPSCPCNFVLTTSKGHVTILDANPALAPANIWMEPTDEYDIMRSRYDKGIEDSRACPPEEHIWGWERAIVCNADVDSLSSLHSYRVWKKVWTHNRNVRSSITQRLWQYNRIRYFLERLRQRITNLVN